MPRQRYVINNMPLRGGVTTAGQHGTIPENQLWQAKNCMSGLDGLITKRPGIWQWGRTLKYPVGYDDVTFYEQFATLDNWVSDDGAVDVTLTVSDGKLVANTNNAAASSDITTLGRVPVSGQADSDDADWSLRFTALGSNMPTDGQFIVSCKAQTANNPYAFRITGDAVEYYATGGTWTTMYAFDFYEAPPTTFEFRFDADGNATLLINDVSVATQAVSGMDAHTAFTVGTYIELTFGNTTALSQQWTLYLTDLMFEGAVVRAVDHDDDPNTDDIDLEPFQGERLGSGTDFKSVVGGNAVSRNLLVAGTKYVYQDRALKKFWSPLLALTGGNVTFSQFGDDIMIFDGDNALDSKLYRWSGTGQPELMDDAPDVRFGTEHRTRLLAAGDKRFPLRLYYTASRSPNVWFAPESDADGQETRNEVLDAGYLQVPGKRGDEIVAVYGEYYGSCIVATNRGIWRLTGSSPISYNIENITQDTGAAAQMAVARLGKDLWLAGRQGISTVATIQEFGDMQAAMPSAPISDLWAPGISNSSIKVDQYQLYKASMAWNPNVQLMYFAFARQGASDVSSIMVYNPVTQSWYGPWESDTTFVAEVEWASPVTQAVMHGTPDGRVGITDPNYRADFDAAYTQTIESPYLCGRSLDPAFTKQIKTWKVLRLYVQLRGAWDLDIKWQTDDETYSTRVESQNIFNLPKMDVDWRLGVDPDGRVHSNQLIGCIEIPLDVHGRYFKFEVSTADDVVGEDLALQGYEVEFTVSGPDQEKE